jgi:sugar porter (SP) family MFS transporter
MQIGINFIAAFVGVGGFLLGYDVGIISGVLAMDSFKATFQFDDWQKGMIVTAFVIGCCFGGTASSFLAERFGRRSALAISSMTFVVGGIAQVFCTTLPQLYSARVVSGFAVGISSAITPFFNSELAPADRRGMLVTLNQIFMTGGIMVAFWINYALQDVHAGWRIAIAGQCVPGVVLFLGCLIVPRSPRWLVQQGRVSEAESALYTLRGRGDVRAVKLELQEIETDVERERRDNASAWGEFCGGVTLRRMVTGCGLQMFQMLTGINSVMYYAPAIFAACGFNNSEQLLATGGVGVVNFASTWLALFLLDRVGRRQVRGAPLQPLPVVESALRVTCRSYWGIQLLVSGALGMALSMAALATLGLSYGAPAPDLAGKGVYCCGSACAATGATHCGPGMSEMLLRFPKSGELVSFNATIIGQPVRC